MPLTGVIQKNLTNWFSDMLKGVDFGLKNDTFAGTISEKFN